MHVEGTKTHLTLLTNKGHVRLRKETQALSREPLLLAP